MTDKPATLKERVSELETAVEVLKFKIDSLEARMRSIFFEFEKHCWTPDAHHPAIVSKAAREDAKKRKLSGKSN